MGTTTRYSTWSISNRLPRILQCIQSLLLSTRLIPVRLALLAHVLRLIVVRLTIQIIRKAPHSQLRRLFRIIGVQFLRRHKLAFVQLIGELRRGITAKLRIHMGAFAGFVIPADLPVNLLPSCKRVSIVAGTNGQFLRHCVMAVEPRDVRICQFVGELISDYVLSAVKGATGEAFA